MVGCKYVEHTISMRLPYKRTDEVLTRAAHVCCFYYLALCKRWTLTGGGTVLGARGRTGYARHTNWQLIRSPNERREISACTYGCLNFAHVLQRDNTYLQLRRVLTVALLCSTYFLNIVWGIDNGIIFSDTLTFLRQYRYWWAASLHIMLFIFLFSYPCIDLPNTYW